MAAGKPVVSTTKGAEGISVKNGENIVIADDADSFAENIISLINQTEYSKKIGEQGIKLTRKSYSWAQIMRPFNQLLDSYD